MLGREERGEKRAAKSLPIGMTLAIVRAPNVLEAAGLLVRVRWSAPASYPAGVTTACAGGDARNVD